MSLIPIHETIQSLIAATIPVPAIETVLSKKRGKNKEYYLIETLSEISEDEVC